MGATSFNQSFCFFLQLFCACQAAANNFSIFAHIGPAGANEQKVTVIDTFLLSKRNFLRKTPLFQIPFSTGTQLRSMILEKVSCSKGKR
jgi:hypothetical protein